MADSTKQDNPESFGGYTWCSKPFHEGSNTMFSLVNTPMFEQEAPKCFVALCRSIGIFTAVPDEQEAPK